MSSFMRRVIDAVWPSGSAWVPKRDAGMDQLIDGLSDGLQDARDQLSTLDQIRDPAKTTLLDELELDFGILPDSNLTDAARRANLDLKKNQSNGVGSDEDLEAVLQAAGFSVFVHSNDPAIDPEIFANYFLLTAGAENAHAGEPDAVAEVFNASLLVNGRFVFTVPQYLLIAGEDESRAGESESVAELTGSTENEFMYQVPSNPDDWPYVFFVGGPAVRDVGGEILQIDIADIPADRMAEFERIILSIKPVTTWAALLIEEV